MISPLSIFRRPATHPPDRLDWTRSTDSELVLAARVGDRAGKEAFVEIVRRHQTAVCAVAFSVTGRIGLTDDIAQEVFLKGWKRIGTLREPAKLKPWLTRIAHDCAVDALRRERPQASLDEGSWGLIESAERSPDAAAAHAEEEQMVWAALAELPENVRTPLILFYREGQSVAAVATALDLSEDTVRQRLSRGRHQLREQVTARVEGVLGRVRPPAMLVVTVAAAIGLLAAPATLAAGAFSTAAAGAGSGASASASTFSTAMTASSYLVATLTMAAFIPLGWNSRDRQEPPAPPSPATTERAAEPADPFELFAGSPLLAEWRRLHEVHGTDAAAMPDLYASIAGITNTFHRRALRSALLAEWAAVDPAGAFPYLLHEKKQSDHAGQLMREWIKLDPAAAIPHLAAHVKGAEGVARSLLKEVAAVAPGQLAAIASQLPAPANRWDRSVEEAFAIAAARDRDAVRTSAEALTGPSRTQALAGVAAGWAATDGPAALEWSRSLSDGPERDGALRATLIGWARSDPAAALRNIDAAPPGREEMTFASDTAAKVVQAASEKDFDGTMRWLEQNGSRLGDEAWLGLTGELQKRLAADTAGTLEFLVSRTESMRRGLKTAFDSIILNEGYAQKDAVWEWLKKQPPGEFIDALRGNVLGAAAWKEPQAALNWMAELPENPESRRLMQQNVSSLINNGANLERVDELLARVPDNLRPQLLATAMAAEGDWKMSDLEPWIARMHELPPEHRAQAAGSLAGRMAAADPQAAIAWASSLTDWSQRQSAIGSLAARWAQADSYEASAWIAGLAPGNDRDTAARALVTSIAAGDPESAWVWAASIADPATRRDSLVTAAHQLEARDPGRARQLINGAVQDPEERAALLQALANRQPGHVR